MTNCVVCITEACNNAYTRQSIKFSNKPQQGNYTDRLAWFHVEVNEIIITGYSIVKFHRILTSLSPILLEFETSNILTRLVSTSGKWIPAKEKEII